MSQAMTTQDHAIIRAWAEARGACPATILPRDRDKAIPRLEFRATDENLADASWEPFFRAFDQHKLAFHYQERTDDGRTSRFYQFVPGREMR